MIDTFNCKICGEVYTSQKSLATHIRKHKLKYKQYFDLYIKCNQIGICLNCGQPTNWDKWRNYYYSFCSNNNRCYGDYTLKGHTLQDRIKTEETRKATFIKKYGVTTSTQIHEIQQKIEKNSVKSKQYILPSGKIIFKRGYEPQFLSYIFKNKILQEDEINYSPKGIKYIGLDSKEHYYFPDFYIPKWNLIIEIKSSWTILLDKNIHLKEKQCKICGYNYIVLINNNFNPLEQLLYTLK